MAKVAVWLVVHLVVLAAAFWIFVGTQLRLGLDSFLSTSASGRLESLGVEVAADLAESPKDGWDGIVDSHVEEYGLEGIFVLSSDFEPMDRAGGRIPRSAMDALKQKLPPPNSERRGPPPRPDDRMPPDGPPDDFGGPPDNFRGPPGIGESEKRSNALFLIRDPDSGDYWAALDLTIGGTLGRMPVHAFLFLKSEDASAGGLFFDYRPWMLGGLAVLAVSLLMWAPFVLGITRYAQRISSVTERIAEGDFNAKIGIKRRDELGQAGESIEEMSTRLGQLISGQKRFLADVSHELCAPLARMRTGLGILEAKADGKDLERIASIDEDAEELSSLVNELLAFTKSSNAEVKIEPILLGEFLSEIIARELDGHVVKNEVPADFCVSADRKHLTRAVQNVFRNCHRHAGEDCEVRIAAFKKDGVVTFDIGDNGSGVSDEEHSRLFEPFYRPDKSRTRDTGGIGLGMAIMESSVRACHGRIVAGRSPMGGLLISISLPGG
ncbi:MAG: ATP-binding protein [Akkermansiaceae bacterium]|nr:ATP-binding protein [Akkermansiaceae bacterium]MDP4647021.1 ATP-binding protein [Akkermansiaceae bacterium]MDP4721280.1 ATP-binding protein [Akkermansiaceae bacterium]MDP4778970.1 ATP-binding protein [Akkermansiaceae bacterium]MDP4897893.1 ATP-binding protein [Akkermansiaceae bacterium]